jgi:hypothetical protein
MLPDALRLLISAYSSGDLAPRRRAAAERLLRHSREARLLLRELRRNRRLLKRLATPALPKDFADRILAALPEPPIIAPRPVARPRNNRWSVAARLTAAAAVLLAVAASSYVLTNPEGEPQGSAASAMLPRGPLPESDPSAFPDPDGERGNGLSAANPPPAPDRAVVKATRTPSKPKKKPPTKKNSTPEPLGNVPFAATKLVQVTPPRLPMSVSARELASDDTRRKVQRELGKADSQHVDLFCRDTARAFERLQNAIKSHGVRVIVDAVAQESVKRKLRGQYVVYCDDLTAADWAKVLQQVGASDRRAEDARAGDGAFDHVVVVPFDTADQKELATVFGSDLSLPPRPAVGKKDVKSAVAAAVSPWRTPSSSREVREYVDGHRDRPANAVAVVLVLRPTNG